MINGTSSKYDLKNWPLTLSRGYFRCWGHALVAFAVDERFKQESMYSLPAGTKKVAVVERWPLAKVRLYLLDMRLIVKNILYACHSLYCLKPVYKL